MNEKLKVYDEKMQKTFDHLEADYQGIRAGRANPHVLDKLRVDYYGTPTPIQQVGNITIPEARMIQIAPWEKSMIKEIINGEDPTNPYSDQDMVKLLSDRGIEISRRTVAKYREGLNIPSSSKRRRY